MAWSTDPPEAAALKQTRVRSGCISCKRSHRKCDERKPSCSRCLRNGARCVYAVPKGTSRTRQPPPLLPATVQKAPPASQLSLGKLGVHEVLYYDRFRNQVAPQMGSLAFGSAEFWLRSVLRETNVDSCVRDAVLAIGALAQAREETDVVQPLYQVSLASPSLSPHYRQAVRYFTRAIFELRSRINNAATQAGLLRTVLISTVLFTLFETLQGNTSAVDKLTAQGILLLKDVILNGASNLHSSTVARPVDDHGILEAESFLIRVSTWNVMYSPLYPHQRASLLKLCRSPIDLLPVPDPTDDMREFCLTWWQMVNLSGIWKIRLEKMFADNMTESQMQESQCELDRLLSRIKAWETAGWTRIKQQKDKEAYLLLMQVIMGAKVLHTMMACALDPTGAMWDAAEKTNFEILALCASPVQVMSLSDTHSVMYDATLAGISKLAQVARNPSIRYGAMDTWRKLLNRHSSWDVRSVFMGTSALIKVEEAQRDETGHIPLSERYEWTHGYWNKAHTDFHVTLTSVSKNSNGKRRRKHMILPLSDFAFT